MGIREVANNKMKPDGFKDFILDQLNELDGLSCRAMFGGYGLYAGDEFFGIVHKGRLYFRTDDNSRGEYLEMGMAPFRPNRKMTLKNYYEVPADVIEEPPVLLDWAVRAARTVL